ncbi:hypothetical protein Lal_00045145, partial [Lupinus albus]
MVVVVGGVIGLELGSVWSRLGAKVTVVEYLDTILGGMDGEVSKQFQRIWASRVSPSNLGAKVTGVEKTEAGAKGDLRNRSRAVKPRPSEADVFWSQTGRKPYTAGLGLEEVGVA